MTRRPLGSNNAVEKLLVLTDEDVRSNSLCIFLKANPREMGFYKSFLFNLVKRKLSDSDILDKVYYLSELLTRPGSGMLVKFSQCLKFDPLLFSKLLSLVGLTDLHKLKSGQYGDVLEYVVMNSKLRNSVKPTVNQIESLDSLRGLSGAGIAGLSEYGELRSIFVWAGVKVLSRNTRSFECLIASCFPGFGSNLLLKINKLKKLDLLSPSATDFLVMIMTDKDARSLLSAFHQQDPCYVSLMLIAISRMKIMDRVLVSPSEFFETLFDRVGYYDLVTEGVVLPASILLESLRQQAVLPRRDLHISNPIGRRRGWDIRYLFMMHRTMVTAEGRDSKYNVIDFFESCGLSRQCFGAMLHREFGISLLVELMTMVNQFDVSFYLTGLPSNHWVVSFAKRSVSFLPRLLNVFVSGRSQAIITRKLYDYGKGADRPAENSFIDARMLAAFHYILGRVESMLTNVEGYVMFSQRDAVLDGQDVGADSEDGPTCTKRLRAVSYNPDIFSLSGGLLQVETDKKRDGQDATVDIAVSITP